MARIDRSPGNSGVRLVGACRAKCCVVDSVADDVHRASAERAQVRGDGLGGADQHVARGGTARARDRGCWRRRASARTDRWRDTPASAALAPRAPRAAARRRSGSRRRAVAATRSSTNAKPACVATWIAMSERLRRASAQGSSENGTTSRTPAISTAAAPPAREAAAHEGVT